MPKKLRLMDIPRMSTIKLQGHLEGETEDRTLTIIFDHLDGMYSYCYLKENSDKLIHLSCGTPLKKVDDHYEILSTHQGSD